MSTINLHGLSAQALEALARRAKKLATDLRGKEPSYSLALEAGIEDRSYKTVRWGWIPSYRGKVEITLEDGSRWLAVGHGPRGNAECVTKDGWIEFRPLEDRENEQ